MGKVWGKKGGELDVDSRYQDYQSYRMSKNRILMMPLLLRTWITRVEWHQRLADVDSGTNCQRLPRVAQHEGQNQDPGFHRLQNQGSFRR